VQHRQRVAREPVRRLDPNRNLVKRAHETPAGALNFANDTRVTTPGC
jgi:hypothetical protein